jgi:hypothetical protein
VGTLENKRQTKKKKKTEWQAGGRKRKLVFSPQPTFEFGG